MSTRRRLILEAIKTRLEAIRVAAGFETDAGEAVYLNEAPAMGPDDPAVAIAILVGDDQTTWQGLCALLRLPIEIQAIAKADLDSPWLAVEDVLGDIKQAVELDDRTLGGLLAPYLERGATATLKREPGSEYVGATIVYFAPYKERFGHPES
jgi:hypothetical protein